MLPCENPFTTYLDRRLELVRGAEQYRRLRAEPPHPLIAEFINSLDRINALAEASTGFIWRLKDDSNNAASIRAFDNPRIALNMSEWESIEALKGYANRCEHVQFFRRKAEWFEQFGGPHLALWRVRAGHVPAVPEGHERLEHLAAHGASIHDFTLRERFPIPQ